MKGFKGKEMKIRKILCLLVSLGLLSAQASAFEKISDKDRYIGADGWLDSFEDTGIYKLNRTLPRSALTVNSSDDYENTFLVVRDPLNKNNRCLMYRYGKFTTAGTSTNRHNPSYEPNVATQLFSIAYTGDCQLSFDMYLPESFYSDGTDSTSIVLNVMPKCTGSLSSSDYQTVSFTKDGLNWPGFGITPLPTGRWFNIKFILHCDVSAGVRADLYVDGNEIGKNNETVFALAGGNGTANIEANGIASTRWTLTTTNSGKTISPEYKVYFDNMEIRAMKDVELLTYRLENNGEASGVLGVGENTFKGRIRNRTGEAVTPIFGIALYKDGVLSDVKMINDRLISPYEDSEYEVSVNIDNADDAEYELRTFLWDGAGTLNSVAGQMKYSE